MLLSASSVSLVGSLLALTAYLAFAGHFAWRVWRGKVIANPVSFAFEAALVASAVWAGAAAFDETLPWPRQLPSALVPALDLARYACWFAFILLLLKPGAGVARFGGLPRLVFLALFGLGVTAGLIAIGGSAVLEETTWARSTAFASLALAVVGLVQVEQLLRNVSEDRRWNAKPVCLGLGTIFLFDLFVYSQAALFLKYDGDALSVRAFVHTVAVPLLFIASRRHKDWLTKLHVSRAAVFHSATLLLVGAYLLLVAAVGYYVRFTGGDWGRALSVALVFVALLVLALVVLSGSMRSRLRVYISKNFFNYRYDYREEWLRFTSILSSGSSSQSMGETVVRAMANLIESPSGTLWIRAAAQADFVQTARWNMPSSATRVELADDLTQLLQARAWVIDLDEARRGHASYGGLVLPAWLQDEPSAWLIIPLLTGSELIGFTVLGRPRTPVELNWEVRDLLKTASSQAASYLAQMQSAEALLESRKFDAFNRMSAFVVHDLKNIVTQLSLMMKNAKRLRDNPEFQQDMLDTVENSLEKMRQLMLQLRDGEKPHGIASGVDLAAIARRLAASAASKGRSLEVELQSSVSTRGHEERVERVIGHVVQNALDATPPEGQVHLRLDESGSHARVQVVDTGCGMSQEFMQNRLFKPFQTTKTSGMGIGAYESYQYLQELGGKIHVESQVNHGTTVTILLPLFHATAGQGQSVTSGP